LTLARTEAKRGTATPTGRTLLMDAWGDFEDEPGGDLFDLFAVAQGQAVAD
jgi:hypothetical protein